MASIEKTICDFFYLKKHVTAKDIPGLRIDKHRLWELTDAKKLRASAQLFKNKRIVHLIEDFIYYHK